jgi:hypothetical protein
VAPDCCCGWLLVVVVVERRGVSSFNGKYGTTPCEDD